MYIKNGAGIKLSREQLMQLPLTHFKNLVIESPEQEALVQEVINTRTAHTIPQNAVRNLDAMTAVITTPEEEAYWQKIVDERRAKVKQREQVEHPITQEQKLEEHIQSLQSEKSTLETSLEVPQSTEKRFCNECDSKGVRHRKSCPKFK